VEAATGGPATGDVPKVGGAPGVAGGFGTPAAGGWSRQATAAPRTPSGAVMRNCLRVFMRYPPPPRCQSGVRVVSDPDLPRSPPVARANSAYWTASCAVLGTYCIG